MNITSCPLPDAPEPPLDLAAFERLTLGNRPLQQRLLTAFLRDLARARSALRHGRPPSWGEERHRLQGSCHFVAAMRLLQALGSCDGRATTDELNREIDLAEAAAREALRPLSTADASNPAPAAGA